MIQYGAEIKIQSEKKVSSSAIFTAVLDDFKPFYEEIYDDQVEDLERDVLVKNGEGFTMVTLSAICEKWKFVSYFSREVKEKVDQIDPEGYSPLMRMVLAREFVGAGYLL